MYTCLYQQHLTRNYTYFWYSHFRTPVTFIKILANNVEKLTVYLVQQLKNRGFQIYTEISLIIYITPFIICSIESNYSYHETYQRRNLFMLINLKVLSFNMKNDLSFQLSDSQLLISNTHAISVHLKSMK